MKRKGRHPFILVLAGLVVAVCLFALWTPLSTALPGKKSFAGIHPKTAAGKGKGPVPGVKETTKPRVRFDRASRIPADKLPKTGKKQNLDAFLRRTEQKQLVRSGWTEEDIGSVELVGKWYWPGMITVSSDPARNLAFLGGGDSLYVIDTAQPDNPFRKSQLKGLPGEINDLAFANNKLYVAAGEAGLRIVDVSNPDTPQEAGFVLSLGYAVGVYVSGDYAYVADGVEGLTIVNIADPAAPVVAGSYTLPDYTYDVQVVGNYAYVAAGYHGLSVVDVSDPAAPLEVAYYGTANSTMSVAVSGSGSNLYAYLTTDYTERIVLDVTNPTDPVYLTEWESWYNPGREVAVWNDFLLVAASSGGLEIHYMGRPAAPYLFGINPVKGEALYVHVSGSYAYLLDSGAGMHIIDLTQLTPPPHEIGSLVTGTGTGAVAMNANYVYLAEGSDGIRVVDVTEPTSPLARGTLLTSEALDIAVSTNVTGTVHLHVADGCSGYRIVDGSDPMAPVEIGAIGYGFDWHIVSLAASGDHAYLIDDSFWMLRVINVSDPTNPAEAAQLNFGAASPHRIAVAGSFAYVLTDGSDLRVINIGTPTAPFQEGVCHLSDPGRAVALAVSGGYAYVLGYESLHVVDVGNAAAPTLLTTLPVSFGFSQAIAVLNNYAYTAWGDQGLRIFDVQTPWSPRECFTYPFDTPGSANDLVVSGNLAYVADGTGGLRVFDVSNSSSSFQEVGLLPTPGYLKAAHVPGSYGYVLDQLGSFWVLDVSDPSNPVDVGWSLLPEAGNEVVETTVVSRTYALVASGTSGLQILDVTNPLAPEASGSFDTPGHANGVAASGSLAYVADGDAGLRILDISNPAAPVEVGFYYVNNQAMDVFVLGNYAYVTDSAYGLRILDVTDPSTPVKLGLYEHEGVHRVFVEGSYAYLPLPWYGEVKIVDVQSPTNPFEAGLFYQWYSHPEAVYVGGGLAYVASYGLEMEDVSDPANPRRLCRYDSGDANSVSVSGGFAYLSIEDQGIQVFRYSPGGPLTVNITPQEAVDAGAMWRVDEGSWRNSGDTIEGLPLGDHTVEFSSLDDWDSAATQTVTVVSEGTTFTGDYVRHTGSITAVIAPQGAIDAGAQWKIEEGAWKNSGDTVPDLPVGGYYIYYKSISGWDAPSYDYVYVTKGSAESVTGTYTQQKGWICGCLYPSQAVAEGAQWSPDGTTWYGDGDCPYLPVGPHTVTFKSITGWDAPSSQAVTVPYDDSVNITGTYLPHTGSLLVSILPSGAVSAGARWAVDGGDWKNSGETVSGLPIGQHTVEFNDVWGWTTPSSQLVTLTKDVTTSTSGTYVQKTGSLTVALIPDGAVASGAQWRVDGGAWKYSGEVVSGLGLGTHTVEFKETSGWITPANQAVGVVPDDTVSAVGTYVIQTGSLTVSITPAEANSAGAQWRVDESTWKAGGTTVTGLTVGDHRVQFKGLTGWDGPADQIVTVPKDATATTSGTYVRQTGSVTMWMSPWAAVNEGAQWRVDGGAWKNNGETVSGLAPGQHTVEFAGVANWTTPTAQTLTVSGGQLVSGWGEYVLQTGSVSVTITPEGANSAGARWRVDAGAWKGSAETASGLTPGDHLVEFKTISGWNSPANQTVTVAKDATATASGTYVQQTGSLTMWMSPWGAVNAGAQWKVDAGAWKNNGETVSGLTPGQHTVEFNTVAGWTTPTPQTLTVAASEMVSGWGEYVLQTGSVSVTITPAEAAAAGAKWRVAGGAWKNSAETASGLTPGDHLVEFKTISGWNSPANQTVTVAKDATASASGTYVQQTGSLTVWMSPWGAVNAGAQWKVDAGAWKNNGETVSGLVPGQHTVEFNTVAGWTTPTTQTLTVAASEMVSGWGEYVLQTGSVSVTITPAEAAAAGAKWRVAGGAWKNSAETASGLTVGDHLVEFKDISGWNSPADQMVTVAKDATATASGTYVQQTGSLTVWMSPWGAVNAGAQWKVDAGAWKNNGETVSGLVPGQHTVEFNTVAGWTTPTPQTLTVAAGEMVSGWGEYVLQTGSVSVTITPAEAAAAGAKWRVAGGAWKNSAETASGLTVGDHLVEFKDISGWTTPADQMVTVTKDATATASGTYVQQTGSLTVWMSPWGAVNAGAQWKVDAGAWKNNGETVSGLVPGQHTVEFNTVAGWTTPTTQTLTVAAGEMVSGWGEYVLQTGSLAVTITPAEAAAAGARWRVDGGLWKNSADTVSGLTVGEHLVEFRDIFGWYTPSAQAVSITLGGLTAIEGAYVVKTGSVTVWLTPESALASGAMWRVDGGAWQGTGDLVSNLAMGPHTIEFSEVEGYTSPSARTVKLTNEGTLTVYGTYKLQTGSLAVTIAPSGAIGAGARWRVDGGNWKKSGAKVTGLPVGEHVVEFRAVPGYTAPAPRTVVIRLNTTTTYQGRYRVIQ